MTLQLFTCHNITTVILVRFFNFENLGRCPLYQNTAIFLTNSESCEILLFLQNNTDEKLKFDGAYTTCQENSFSVWDFKSPVRTSASHQKGRKIEEIDRVVHHDNLQMCLKCPHAKNQNSSTSLHCQKSTSDTRGKCADLRTGEKNWRPIR